MYIKVHFGALKFSIFSHFLVLQCTTNGANSSSWPLISNLHAPRIILNPILPTFKWLLFGLILADLESTVLEYSTFPHKKCVHFRVLRGQISMYAKFKGLWNNFWRFVLLFFLFLFFCNFQKKNFGKNFFTKFPGTQRVPNIKGTKQLF